MLLYNRIFSTDFIASSNWRLKAFIKYLSVGLITGDAGLAGLLG